MVENDVAKSIQLELYNIAKHIPYNKNQFLNKIINNHITVEDVKKAVKKLQQNKSPGPDNIFNEFILNGGEFPYI